jgi:hypothetical protein
MTKFHSSLWLKFHCVKITDFLIHLTVVGNLGCFHSLAIVNSAAINMGVQVYLLEVDLHSLGYMPGVGLLDPMAYIFLVF